MVTNPEQTLQLYGVCIVYSVYTIFLAGWFYDSYTVCQQWHILNKPCNRTVYVWVWPEPYIRFIYGILGREITKYTVIYGVYKRFWPTLCMYSVYTIFLAGWFAVHVVRVGQNHTRYMSNTTKYLVKPLQNTVYALYMHRIWPYICESPAKSNV